MEIVTDILIPLVTNNKKSNQQSTNGKREVKLHSVQFKLGFKLSFK